MNPNPQDAQVPPKYARPNPQEAPHGLHTLENGLQVLFVPTNSSVTTLNITYRVGSRNEGLCQTGDTHLLEHMMFGGSLHFKGTNGMWKLEELGAAMNATTYLDRTNYYETLETKYLTEALAREADRMLCPLLSAEKLVSEMPVVRNERERGTNSPFQLMNSKMMSCAFLEHPYGHSTIGYLADVEHVTAANLQEYHHKYYKPNNATLTMTGNIPANALAMVRKHFDPVPRGTTADIFVVEPLQHGMRRYYEAGNTGIVGIGFKCPNGLHPHAIELELLAHNINNNGIFDHLVNDGTVFNISAQWQRMKDPFLFTIWASAKDPIAAEHAIWDVIRQKPSFDLPKEAVKNGWHAACESSQGMAAEINEAIARGDWRDVWCRHRVLDECDGSNMWTYLVPEQATVGTMLHTPAAHAVPVGSYSATTPTFSPTCAGSSEVSHLSHGTFVHAENIHLRIEYQSGMPRVLNALHADMITKGCGSRSDSEIQLLMGAVGVVRHTEATQDGFALSYNGPPHSIDLVMDELLHPTFAPGALQKTLRMHAQSLVMAQNNPDLMVMHILQHKLYNEPMPMTNLEHLQNCNAIEHRLMPTKITCAGPPMAIQKMIQLYVPGFTHTEVPQNTQNTQNTQNEHMNSDKTSCAVVWGCAVKENAALTIAASALGGGFAGRLMKKIRDEMGLTYGIYAGIKDGMLVVKSSFNPTLLQTGIQETEAVIQQWRHGIDIHELTTHKQMLLGKRAVLKDDMCKYVNFLHCSVVADEAIRAVTLDHVRDALGALPQLVRISTGRPI